MTSKPFTIHPFACSFRSEIYKNLFGVSIISFRKLYTYISILGCITENDNNLYTFSYNARCSRGIILRCFLAFSSETAAHDPSGY